MEPNCRARRSTPGYQRQASGAPILVRWEAGQGGQLRLHAEDAGTGIPDQLSERIFRPFFSNSTQGSDLGLNIAAKVMDLAEGWLAWTNLEGGGSRFTLVLRQAARGSGGFYHFAGNGLRTLLARDDLSFTYRDGGRTLLLHVPFVRSAPPIPSASKLRS